MSKEKKGKSFVGKARSWASKKGLFGPKAFLRYVLFTYLDALSEISSDFIFKGGNLLWIYIQTPRATIDLDLATIKEMSHLSIKKILTKACLHTNGISFSIKKFEDVKKQPLTD